MNFNLITLFPEMVEDALKWGVIGRAFEKGLGSFSCTNPRDFTSDVHKTVDDRPFGGGDGMVMLYEPLSQVIKSIPDYKTSRKIYLSPRGRLLNETLVEELATEENFILLSGRYGGVDQRVLSQYDFEEISVGDYVVSGGELPSLILMDAVMRKVPGVLGNNDSSNEDSFAGGKGFEAPQFTKPRENEAGKVPDVLLSGDHKKIKNFREMVGLVLTLKSRPELLEGKLSEKELSALKAFEASMPKADQKLLLS